MIDAALARTVAVVARTGSLDAAARELHVTPSAISQRLKTLERDLGTRVLHRTRPVELTAAGQALVRYARQLEDLERDLAAELDPDDDGRPIALTVVVNADSLHTWALPALASVADAVAVEVLREDEAHSLDLLRDGRAAGAVTAVQHALPGCSSERLGVMRYRAVCAPGFRTRWLDDADDTALARAPQLAFDRKDDLQGACLRVLGIEPADPPLHHIPASAEFAEAIRLGIGWGMVPEIECGPDLQTGALVPVDTRGIVDVPLHWQQWRRAATAVRTVGDALRAEAGRTLRR